MAKKVIQYQGERATVTEEGKVFQDGKWVGNYDESKPRGQRVTPRATGESTSGNTGGGTGGGGSAATPETYPQPVTNPDGSVTYPPYPDGSQLTTYPDGKRVITYPDGTTQELAPGQSVTDPALLNPAVTRPSKPTVPAGLAEQGWDYVWNDDTESWELQQNAAVSTANRERLRAQFKATLAQYGQDTPGNVALIERAVANGWTLDKFLLEWRATPDYLANPIFAANMERVKQGKAFIDEGTLLRRRDEQKRLAKQYGFEEPSDNYIAQGMLSGLSDAEVEHRFSIQKNVNDMGGGVRWVYENILGQNITDQDLYEIFDPEIDTAERDEAYRDALYRGRPMLLGLGIRSQAEADALQMLLGSGKGNVEEAFSRYEKLGADASRFQRLGAIEDLITQGLPDDFGNFSTEENSTLVRALLFNDQDALARMQDVMSREIARFKQGGTPVGAQGQLVGLLNPEQRASFG